MKWKSKIWFIPKNLILSQEKIAAEVKHVNLRRNQNRVSTTFAHQQQLNNPQLNLCHDDKNDTLHETFEHVFPKDLTFKNLSNPRKGKIVTDVVWEDDFLDAEAKRVLFFKTRAEIRETRFDAKLLLADIDKSVAWMNSTGAEILRRVDKKGEEARTGKLITNKIYGSIIPLAWRTIINICPRESPCQSDYRHQTNYNLVRRRMVL
jgi:hypothetical protein